MTIAGFGTISTDDIIINTVPLSNLVLDTQASITDVILERNLTSASTVQLQMIDPLRQIINSGIFSQGDVLTFQGLQFVLVQFEKQSDQLQLTFESMAVYQLRQQTGPLSSTSNIDLAGFAQMLVAQVPNLTIVTSPIPIPTAAIQALTNTTTNNTVQATAVSGSLGEVVAAAESQLGVPYQYGGTSPGVNLDCSGLTQYCYKQAGITIPRTSEEQWTFIQQSGTVETQAQAQPGDLVFFAGGDGTQSSPGHVGIYVGNGQMIDAYETGTNVRYDPLTTSGALTGFGRAPGITVNTQGQTPTVSATTANAEGPTGAPATNQAWAEAVLDDLGLTVPANSTGNNVNNIMTWMVAENAAADWYNRNNPLNNGLGSGGGAGLGSYPDLSTAALYAAQNISQGYPTILAALTNNAPFATFRQAVIQSSWSGGPNGPAYVAGQPNPQGGHYNNGANFPSTLQDTIVAAPPGTPPITSTTGAGVSQSSGSTSTTSDGQAAIARGTSDDPGEDSWTCLQRLSTTAGWRCWESEGVVYFGGDDYWIGYFPSAGTVNEFTETIMNIDFDYDVGKPLGTATITALTTAWFSTPGQPITLTGVGPANGVWLTSDIQRDDYSPECTIQAIVPTPPATLIANNTAASATDLGLPS